MSHKLRNKFRAPVEFRMQRAAIVHPRIIPEGATQAKRNSLSDCGDFESDYSLGHDNHKNLLFRVGASGESGLRGGST
jgi:hypothetical protein